MAKLKVINPVAVSVETHFDPAPRLRDLDGKRIGLYWNMKPGGDVALQWVEELLKRRYPRAQFEYCTGDLPSANTRRITPREADRLAKEVDAIVGTTSD